MSSRVKVVLTPTVVRVNVTTRPADAAPEGTTVLSTGETGTDKFLRVDGDGTSSWQQIAALDERVAYTAQTKTDAQKTTARGNIAASVALDWTDRGSLLPDQTGVINISQVNTVIDMAGGVIDVTSTDGGTPKPGSIVGLVGPGDVTSFDDDGVTTATFTLDADDRLVLAYMGSPQGWAPLEGGVLTRTNYDSTKKAAMRSAIDAASGEDLAGKLSLSGGSMTGGLQVLDRPTGDDSGYAANTAFVADSIRQRPLVGARVSNGINTQTIQPATWTKLQACLDWENWDTDGWMDNARFQPTVAGYYEVSGIWVAQPVSDGVWITAIYKNGFLHSVLGRGVATGGSLNGFGGTDTIPLNGTSEYIEMWAYQATGAAVQTYASYGYQRFTAQLVGGV